MKKKHVFGWVVLAGMTVMVTLGGWTKKNTESLMEEVMENMEGELPRDISLDTQIKLSETEEEDGWTVTHNAYLYGSLDLKLNLNYNRAYETVSLTTVVDGEDIDPEIFSVEAYMVPEKGDLTAYMDIKLLGEGIGWIQRGGDESSITKFTDQLEEVTGYFFHKDFMENWIPKMVAEQDTAEIDGKKCYCVSVVETAGDGGPLFTFLYRNGYLEVSEDKTMMVPIKYYIDKETKMPVALTMDLTDVCKDGMEDIMDSVPDFLKKKKQLNGNLKMENCYLVCKINSFEEPELIVVPEIAKEESEHSGTLSIGWRIIKKWVSGWFD